MFHIFDDSPIKSEERHITYFSVWLAPSGEFSLFQFFSCSSQEQEEQEKNRLRQVIRYTTKDKNKRKNIYYIKFTVSHYRHWFHAKSNSGKNNTKQEMEDIVCHVYGKQLHHRTCSNNS